MASDTLYRLKNMLTEAKINDNMAVAKFKDVELKLVSGQQDIKESIANSLYKTQLDTTRLLKICMGIASGVERMDDRNLRSQRQTERQSQTLLCKQRRTEASVNRMSKSMTVYATKTSILLSQLLRR